MLSTFHYSHEIIILSVIVAALAFLFHRAVRKSINWRATVTPLASIIGSGFLVVAPLLHSQFGRYAPLAMLALVVFGYVVGFVLRENIATETRPPSANILKTLARIALVAAYLVSVAFYIELLSDFLVHGFGKAPDTFPNLQRFISTAIILFIAARSCLKGFVGLERLEEYAVSGKLAIICGLLTGLVGYNIHAFQISTWTAGPNVHSGWTALRILMGSLIVVQGFETSQFLGAEYSPQVRIKTMRNAQLISSVIYLVFITLMLCMFQGDVANTDTAIIDLSGKVSRILPSFLVFAAVLSQFSAAIADTIGAGGLLGDLKIMFSPRFVYLPILIGSLGLVWLTNVFQIVAIASRLFAFYYALECLRAAHRNLRVSKTRMLFQIALSLALFACVLLGLPAEGS
jgi:hypothetical protein